MFLWVTNVFKSIEEIKLTCFGSMYTQHEYQKVTFEGAAHCRIKCRL